MRSALRPLLFAATLGLTLAPARALTQGGAPPSDDAMQMGSPPALPDGMTEEQIWPAATAEGWLKPVLVPWQRTFDDALRAAKARNVPILVAVNMDGEIASEHFAGVRYRQPETAAMMARYVCIVASVYRHTPRDYDEGGQRVPCPRLGTVTCGEHIQAERDLYEKYFDGKRVSPRHIVLELDGKERYDVYYSWDTETVFTTFRKGVEGLVEPPRGERTRDQWVQSADVVERQALERSYAQGDRETRRAILESLRAQSKSAARVDHVEVLRAAIYGFDVELASLARQALADGESDAALELIGETLKHSMPAAERERLLAAVDRIALNNPRARTLASLHSGLNRGSKLVEGAPDFAAEYERNRDQRRDVGERTAAADARPTDAAALVESAQALCELALQSNDSRHASLLYEDARRRAQEARKLGASGPRLDALLAIAAEQSGDRRQARDCAIAAVEGGLWSAVAPAAGTQSRSESLPPTLTLRVLRLFALGRQQAIRDAFRAGRAWPPEWLADVNAAYARLTQADSGLGFDEALVLEHYDFLRWLGATPQANGVLDAALKQAPDSAELHDRLRARLLFEGGPAALERAYGERALALGDGNGTQATWYAGYAFLVAAEHYRRRNDLDAAEAAYQRGIQSFQRTIAEQPDAADNPRHFIALAEAGRARMRLERDDLAGATDRLIEALSLRPDSAASLDGLGLSPVMTAKMLGARLEAAGDRAQSERLKSALARLDPKLLEPPPNERAVPGGPRRQRQPGQQQDGR